MLKPAACLVVIASVAGCGGSSTADRHAAWATWQRSAGKICKRTQQRIVARGGAAEYAGLRTVVTGARSDVHVAVRDLERLPRPDGGDARAWRIVTAARAVEAALAAEITAARRSSITAVLEATQGLEDRAKELEYQANVAGVATCGRSQLAEDIADALRAPTIATDAAAVQADLIRRLKRAAPPRGVGPLAVRRAYLQAAHGVDRVSAYAKFDYLNAPAGAWPAGQRYFNALEELATTLRTAASVFADTPLERSKVLTRVRAIRPATSRVDRTYQVFARRLQSVAPPAPGAGSQDDPTAPAGGDDQADA